MTFEGGHERADEPSEPNFNRDGERREHVGSRHDGGRSGREAPAAAAEAVVAQAAVAAAVAVRVADAADRGASSLRIGEYG